MGQGPCVAGRDDASVDAAAAADRALGACASVMMPAVNDMRASSVEVPGDLWEKGGFRVALPRVFRLWDLQGTKGKYRDSGVGGRAHIWHTERGLDSREQVSSRL